MLILYRIYQLLVFVPLALTSTILTALITIIGSFLFGNRWWGYWPPHYWSKFMCWLTLVRVTVKGGKDLKKDQSYVFVANHQGAYDIFAIYGWLGHNFKWMMKASLEKIPLVGFACRCAGHIFVNNQTTADVKRTMEDAKRQLAKGNISVVIFPEGHRSLDGKLQPFKKGAFLLAKEFELPVVPITIQGAYEIMPKEAKIPRWGHITLTIHQPIEMPEGGYNIRTLLQQSQDAIASAIKNDDAESSKENGSKQ